MVENEKRRKYIMPALHSHTHCQAAQATAQTKAWQRVCLYNRTTKPTDKPADEKEHRSDNSGFAKKRVQWLIEHTTSHQILWYVDSLVLRNPLLRQAPKRYMPL
jgi:hypothetical protein